METQLATREDGTGYLGISPMPYMEEYSFFGSLKKTGSWFGWIQPWSVFRVLPSSSAPPRLKQLLGISEPTMERPVTVVGITRIRGTVAGCREYSIS